MPPADTCAGVHAQAGAAGSPSGAAADAEAGAEAETVDSESGGAELDVGARLDAVRSRFRLMVAQAQSELPWLRDAASALRQAVTGAAAGGAGGIAF